MAKKKKFSINDRVKYYNDKYARGNAKQKALCAGYIDRIHDAPINSSKFKTNKEKESYFKGVERAENTIKKIVNVKF